MDNKKKLGKRIQELRKKKGYTQEKVAELISMEQNTISVIESGRNFPTLATLEKIANVLDVELSDFFIYDYLDDIDVLKVRTQTKINSMDENQIRKLFQYIKSI
jgi:transcriptional regulator with XRE-family HTH domain